ncbi:Scr1 family TA system antitoxin-like transcriptional regulator [Nocardiopsis sp. NPDC058631]|uniref:helix-turn-helix domain-containing protein n=1 Tax=Nocardiopsis sp. NPDC058631 TaxID=3346566 RepID=UPI00364F95C5
MSEPPFHEVLTTYRELSGLTQQQLAGHLGCSAASVSRWACGHALPFRETAEQLDQLLEAGGKVIHAWRTAKSGKSTPEWARPLMNIETRARHVQAASPALVPGYLQSPLYAGAVFRAWHPAASDAEIAHLARIRTERLGQLPELRITAVFPLYGIASFDAAVRTEQARHLVELAEQGRVRIHLVPQGAILLSVTSPVLVFRLDSGETVISSDHIDGNVIYDADRNDKLAALVMGAMADALPARLSLEALKELA